MKAGSEYSLEEIKQMIEDCEIQHIWLNEWELNFLDSIKYHYLEYRDLTDRQVVVLSNIHKRAMTN